MQAQVPMTALTLDSSIAIKLTMGSQMFKERALMSRNDAWHRIKIIRGARYDKEVILRTILQAVEPADLIPVRYQVNGEDAYFMARNCGPALEMLCRSNLIVNTPSGDPIVIIVTLAFASIHDLKINIQPILLSALTRRYNTITKYLRLDNFHRDDEIAKTVYCPLSQTKTLGHTLKLAKTALGPFEYLNLQHNDLTNLAAMENSNLPSLRGLDIRHNNLLTMQELASLKTLTITEIWLDGNPLCENYATSERYVQSAKRYCPNLKKIDGVSLDSPELPLILDSYHRVDSESKKIVDQFLRHFFNIYDHKDRSLLSGLYHKNAFYSLTLGITSNINRQNLGPYIMENRNILDSLELTKSHELLYQGPDDIVAAFKKLPDTLHDRRSFRCDIMHEEYRRILVSVEGIFKATLNSVSSIFSFSRTFMLVGRDDNEYNIINDQCHINTTIAPSTIFHEDIDAIMNNRNEDENLRDIELTPRNKERMIYTLMEVTTMNTEWCHRFLNDTNWDPKRAILNFMDNYKSCNIPFQAFSR